MNQVEEGVSVDFLFDGWELNVQLAIVELVVCKVIQHIDVNGVLLQRLRAIRLSISTPQNTLVLLLRL